MHHFALSWLAGLAVAVVATGSVPLASANETDALLEALVKRGVLNEKDAAAIQAEGQQQEQQSTANKIKLSNSLTELRLYGDIRLRYQHDNTDYQVDPTAPLGQSSRSPAGNQRDRFRLRLRLDADFKLADQWFGGVELQTGYGSDTANQTAENGFADYPIFISRAYLGYSPTDWLTLTAGKLNNPFYTTELVWDPDVNPFGFVEQISLSRLFGRPGQASKGQGASAPSSPWDLNLVAGQLLFDDNAEGGGRDPGVTDHDATTDAWLFDTQIIASYRFASGVKATLAPAWMVYNAASFSVPTALTGTFGDANTVSFQDSPLVSGATRNLNILTAPGDISFKLGRVATKVYWDVAYNIAGRSRAEDTYHLEVADPADPNSRHSLHRTRDDFAWLAGFQLGENRKKGDLSFLANYRETGISSVDPNLNDNEFALGFLNTRGFRLSLNYNVSDSAVLSVTYYGAWSLDKNLVGGEATGDNAIANANAAQTLQLDLNVKF